MGRYFQTAPTQFIDNYIYQPPWELIEGALSKKQQEYDNILATAKLFNDIKINHLNSEDENYNVAEKQRYYSERAQAITEAIAKDKMNTSAYIPLLDELQKEITKDFTSGDISKIQGSYNAYQKWMEDNKKRKEENASRYSAAERYYLNEWSKAGGNSLNQQWRGEQVTKDLDYDALRKSIGELKASSVKETRKTPAGNMYMVEREGKREELTEGELQTWLMAQVVTPENLASLAQSAQYGLGTYLDSEGKLDWKNGTLFAPLRGMTEAGAYFNSEDSLKYSEDTTAMGIFSQQQQNARQQAVFEHDKNMKYLDFELDQIKEANKSKSDKINAYDLKIAEAQIIGDSEAIAYWQNAKDNLTGNAGLVMSNYGSKYKDLASLQKSSAEGDKVAQKILSEELNTLFKNSSIDFNDPIQKNAALKLVGLIKQNKLSLDNIDTELDKIIPVKKNKVNFNDKKQSDAIWLRAKRMQNEDNMLNSILMRTSQNKNLQFYKDKAVEEEESSRPDLNKSLRENLKNNMKNIFNNFKDDWENKKNFSTAYETAPLSIATQSRISTQMRDPEISKEWFIEKNGKQEVLLDHMKDIVSFTSATGADGFGRNGLVALDKNGNQYRVTANQNTPAYISIMNSIKQDVNSNTELGMSIKYPTVARLKQITEGSKRLGNKSIRQDIKVNNSNYTIIGDANDGFYAIDYAGNIVTGLDSNKQPIKQNYIELGQGLEKISK